MSELNLKPLFINPTTGQMEYDPNGSYEPVRKLTAITYFELKNLRDTSQLIPGMQYRITDYSASTTKENTKSAGHEFDLIVTADSINTVNENARAINHNEPRPTLKLNGYLTLEGVRYDIESRWYYDGIRYVDDAQSDMCVWIPENPESVQMLGNNLELYSQVGVTDITDILTQLYAKMNNTMIPYGYFLQYASPSEIYNTSGMDYEYPITLPSLYFKDSRLESWNIKYCLDNDVSRFKWASVKSIRVEFVDELLLSTDESMIYEGETYYWWRSLSGNNSVVTKSQNPHEGDQSYWIDEGAPNPGIGLVTNTYEDGSGVIYYMKDEFGNEAPFDFKNIQFYTDDEWRYLFGSMNGEDLTVAGSCVMSSVAPTLVNNIMMLQYITIKASSINNVSFNSGCTLNIECASAENVTFGSGCTNITTDGSSTLNSCTFGNSCSGIQFEGNCEFKNYLFENNVVKTGESGAIAITSNNVDSENFRFSTCIWESSSDINVNIPAPNNDAIDSTIIYSDGVLMFYMSIKDGIYKKVSL